MALNDCPWDEETGLFVVSMRWLPTECQRCHPGSGSAVVAEVKLADYNAGEEETLYLCEECAQWYARRPKGRQ